MFRRPAAAGRRAAKKAASKRPAAAGRGGAKQCVSEGKEKADEHPWGSRRRLRLPSRMKEKEEDAPEEGDIIKVTLEPGAATGQVLMEVIGIHPQAPAGSFIKARCVGVVTPELEWHA